MQISNLEFNNSKAFSVKLTGNSLSSTKNSSQEEHNQSLVNSGKIFKKKDKPALKIINCKMIKG